MLLILILLSLDQAQSNFGSDGTDVIDVSLDGGLTFFIAAGVDYVAKKLRVKGENK
jgi:hypothetical protein